MQFSAFDAVKRRPGRENRGSQLRAYLELPGGSRAGGHENRMTDNGRRVYYCQSILLAMSIPPVEGRHRLLFDRVCQVHERVVARHTHSAG